MATPIKDRDPNESFIRRDDTKAFSRTPVHWNEKNAVDFQDGMDLRDYFAAKAMQAMITKEKNATDEVKIAKMAYTYADALVAERKKK